MGNTITSMDQTMVELRSNITFVIAILACTLWAATARADDWIDCQSNNAVTSIPACTAVIKAGNYSNDNIASAYEYRGNGYSDKGDYKRAIKDYGQAIALKPGTAEIFNSRGVAYQLTHNLTLAFKDYNRAIELDPALAKAYYNHGLIYQLRRNFALAIKDYDRAISLNPASANAYGNRGNSYEQLGEKQKAEADYHMALKLRPGDGVATRGLKRLKRK